jgi:hypothetical protein
MSYFKLILSIVSPLGIAAVLMAASEAQPPPGGVFVPSGDGRLVRHSKPKTSPRHKVGFAWEQYVDDVTGEDYLDEHTRYSNGDVESTVGPEMPGFVPWEFEPQFTPTPGSVVPPACNSVLSTSTLTGSAQTGRVVFDASVMCWRFGSGSTPCNTVKMTIYVDLVDAAGDLHPIAYTYNTYNSGCGATSHPYWDYTVATHGTIRVTAKLFDLTTFAILANQTIEFQFTG